jgi:HD-GYP domain-containing protein (c-di-GMP phosphodiesterase class II)
VALAQRVGFEDAATLREIAIGAMLHDVGKSRIASDILTQNTPLTDQQWEIMKLHPTYGYEMVRAVENVGEIALDIVLHHHEKLRGGGYPDKLSGRLISPFVRLVSICDAFDALTTERPHQEAMPSFKALSFMRTQIAEDFDADYFRAFVTMMGERL